MATCSTANAQTYGLFQRRRTDRRDAPYKPTTHKFTTLEPGDHTETIPVYFQGKKDFTADVKYSYTIKEGSSGIEEPMGDEASFKIENGELVVTGNVSSVRVVDLYGRKLYDGCARQRIQLAHGIYVIQIDGKTYKVVI